MTILSKIIDNDRMQQITSEFSRLKGRCYLENSGAALYPQSLLYNINEDLMKNVYMNPHTDKYTRDCIEQIRYCVLNHFNTDSTEYTVIFTSGTTQSLKLVVESFKFSFEEDEVLNCGSFVYLRDNHTSVLGLREIADSKNADIIHISHNDFLNSLNPNNSSPSLQWKEKYKNEGNTLLVYPAQSNFNGYKYPIDCVESIKGGCLNNYIKKHLCKVNCNWYILLDAASYVATNKLDLSKTQPDFVCMSFYKIFGYPTGLGALLVKNSSENVLSQKLYYGGGTVDIVLSSEDYHVKRENLYERFEDGTSSFLAIISLKHCFDAMNRLIPKVINHNVMETIAYHTFYLAQDFYNQLKSLKHSNGVNVAELYMDSEFNNAETQGGIVTFNIIREDESYVGYAEFQHIANLFNISVRTGCFCNSGSCQRHLKATNKEMKDMHNAGHKCGDEIDLIGGKPTGAVRASFGYYNTFKDVDKLIHVICDTYTKKKSKKPKRTFENHKNGITNVPPKNNDEIVTLMKETTYSYKNIELISNKTPHSDYSLGKIYLQEMAIFPIKSCGAFKIPLAWKIGAKGFEYDREWMIVKDNGVCLTQKQNPNMCMIRPVIDLKKKKMTLYFKDKTPISISLQVTREEAKPLTICSSKVCTDLVKGIDCGDDVSNWISEALEISYLRLVRQSDETTRQKKRTDEEDMLLSLSNQAQFLLINKASVRWLSNKIQDPTFTQDLEQLTDRFRGNIIIDMDQELVERDWQRLIIGKHEFKVDGPCMRCQMVCIDQQTGNKTVEPLRTIAGQLGGKIRFGIYLSYVGPIDGSKDRVLRVNSSVRPLSQDEDLSRFNEWFFKYFLTNCCTCDMHCDHYDYYEKFDSN